jgi:hypothetical protein
VDSIARLPDREIQQGGVVGDAFLRRGITTFREACQWVRDLPYGPNSRPQEPADGRSSPVNAVVLFEDNRGTCFTKHGVIARLAGELGLNVYKNLGFYRLNDDIVTGVGEVLAPQGLTFIPQIHCFLEYGRCRVDLTEGNCHGKNKTIEVYDFVVRVAPESSRDELQRLYADHLKLYLSFEPRLAALAVSTITDLMMACNQVLMSRCAVTAAASRPVGAEEPREPQEIVRQQPETLLIS